MRPILFGLAALLSFHVSAAAKWLISEEGKSPLDDSPTLLVLAIAERGGSDLVLQCKEGTTGAFFYNPHTFFGSTAVQIDLRIGDGKATKQTWWPMMGGRAIVPDNSIQFIRSLPDNGRIFIRAPNAYGTEDVEGRFNLDNTSMVRNKLARACKWSPDLQQKKIERQPN